MKKKMREQIKYVYVHVFYRLGQSERWLKIEAGPRMEDKNWEKGVS